MENEYFDIDEIMVIDFDKNGWHGYFGNQFSIIFQRKHYLLKDKGKLKTLVILKQC